MIVFLPSVKFSNVIVWFRLCSVFPLFFPTVTTTSLFRFFLVSLVSLYPFTSFSTALPTSYLRFFVVSLLSSPSSRYLVLSMNLAFLQPLTLDSYIPFTFDVILSRSLQAVRLPWTELKYVCYLFRTITHQIPNPAALVLMITLLFLLFPRTHRRLKAAQNILKSAARFPISPLRRPFPSTSLSIFLPSLLLEVLPSISRSLPCFLGSLVYILRQMRTSLIFHHP